MTRKRTDAGFGDSDWCPVPGHGRMYLINGRDWCPHVDHTKDVGRSHRGTVVVLPELTIDLEV